MTTQSRPRIGRFNALGVATLVRYETSRWLRLPIGYIVAPVLNSLLLFAVFRLALPADVGTMGGIPLAAFIVPGLVAMAVLHNAFETTAWSIIDLKIRGTIVDLLMPPLSSFELLVAFAVNGMARGLAVGALGLGAMAPFAGLGPVDMIALVGFAAGGALALALAGIIVGIQARKFDHVATIDAFAVVPLAFLSGSFYAVGALPEPWRALTFANPLFHVVDGLRAGLTGAAQGDLGVAGVVVFLAILGLGAIAWRMLALSPKLRP
ncbi:MAG: ABC transporter permease [Alphaproteobacteria bacterium]